MNPSLIIKIASHLRVIEVPLLLVIVALLLRATDSMFYSNLVILYALIRLFINIRFKISKDKLQQAILNHIDVIVEDMENEEKEKDGIL